MPSPQGSILSNIRPPSSDSNNIGKSLLGALSWKQNYDLNNSEERRRQEAHELNKSVYQAKTAAARSQASAAGEKAQREQALQNMQFINRLGKKLLQADQSQWGAILAPNMPALEQIGYTPQILSNMTPEQVQGVVAQTDAALYDFDRDMKRKEFEASRIDADRGYNLDRDKFGADRVDANRDYALSERELDYKKTKQNPLVELQKMDLELKMRERLQDIKSQEQADQLKLEDAESAKQKLASQQASVAADAQRVLSDIEDVRKLATGANMGRSGDIYSALNAEGDANALRHKLKTIQSNIGFDKLMKMKSESPTGGALGAVSERELGDLQAVLGYLNTDQSPEQLESNLNKVEGFYKKLASGSQSTRGGAQSVGRFSIEVVE